jgi:NAD(P)-dependent dehydrogenase (short-subunit alcohol dehydrogenase family)
MVVDISDESSVSDLFSRIENDLGRLDILDNNAGLVGPSMAKDVGLLDFDVSVWDEAFAINSRGTMLVSRYAIPLIRKTGGGSIINIVAGAATWGDVRSTAYGSSKAAVLNLTRYMAVQHFADNIRCNALAPGVIFTEHNKNAVSQALRDEIAFRQLRNGEPADIARVVLFLASDLSRFVTGQFIRVDGGLSAGSPYLPIRAAELKAQAHRDA